MDFVGDLIRSIRKYGIETVFRRYYSEYRGQVLDVEDEQNRCRVLVKVPELFGDVALANFAEPILHGGQAEVPIGQESASNGKYMGAFFPPKVGDWVTVVFEKGHPTYPRYKMEAWITADERIDEMGEAEFWNDINPIFISRRGHKIYVDETEGKAKIVMKTNYGLEFVLDEEEGKENVSIVTTKGQTLKVDDTEGAEKILIQDYEQNKFEFNTSTKDCNLDIKNDWNITVENAVNMTVKGDLIATVNGDVDAAVDGEFNAIVQGNANVDIQGNLEATVGGDATANVTGDINAKCAALNVEAEGTADIKAGGPCTIDAPNIIAKSGSASNSPVLTLGLNPVIDLITGAPHVGVTTFLA